MNRYEKNELFCLTDGFSLGESLALAVLDACPVPCALNDDEQNITYLNKAFTDIVGYTLEDIPNLSAWWPKAYPDKEYRDWVSVSWGERLAQARETGGRFEPMELNIHCKDGRIRTMLINAASIKGKFEGTHLVVLNDITDRKLFEEITLHNADLFMGIFASFPTGVMLVDESGFISQANDRLLEQFGYSHQELIGKPVDILIPSRIRQAHKNYMSTYMQQPQACQMGVGRELHGLRKNGSEFNVEIGLQPVETAEGLMILATVADITERLQIQNELKHSEEWSRSLFENTNVCIASTDGKGQVDRFNKAFVDLLGYDEQTLRTKNFGEFTHPEDLQHEMVYFNEILANKRDHYRIEKRYIHRDGHILWVDLSTSVIRAPDGSVMQFVAVLHDITENRQSRMIQADLSRILENSLNEIFIFDAETLKFLMVNKGARTNLGYSNEEIIGRLSPLDIKPHFTPELFAKQLEPLIRNEHKIIHFETAHCRKDGTQYPVSVQLQKTSYLGREAYLALVVDITEQKKMETAQSELQSQVMQIQKLDSLGKMVGGVAHDFNNLLGSILGYAELLRLEVPNENKLSERHQNYISQIGMAGKRAKELISQMLIYSRPEQSDVMSSNPVILLSPIIKEATQLLRSMIPSSIEISCKIVDEEILGRISPVGLNQIILNLAVNARDAINEYGQIEITLDQTKQFGVCASCHKEFDGKYASLKVRDSGVGMTSQLLNKIFDPFYTTKEVGKGTGMGLSVVHGIVHSIHGHITVSSVKGEGTEFTILLPAEEGSAIVKEMSWQNSVVGNALAGLNILVVDDDQVLATMISEFLNLYAMNVKVFTNSVEAWSDFESSPNFYDMAILDVTMPELSGMDLARSMLKLRPEFPVLLCTGFSDRVNVDVIHKVGIAGFMRKPLELLKVLEWIKNIRYGQY